MGNRSALKSCLKQNVKGNTLQRYVDYAVNLGGVVGCWPLQEASGDRRGYIGDQPLTDNATVTGGDGPSESLPLASDFETGNSEYLSAADAAAHSFGGDMHLVAIVNAESLPAAEMYIVGKDGAVGSTREWLLAWTNSVNRFRFGQGNATFSTLDLADATTLGLPVVATWYMLEGDVNTVLATVGIRGNLGGRDSVAKTATMANGTAGLTIGSRGGGTPALFWDGLIATILLLRRILQRFEAQNIYELGMGRTP